MEIFVINLKRSSERRASISRQLGDLGLKFRLLEAVDARSASDAELALECDLTACHESKMPRGAIACTLSHIHVYQTMVKEEIDAALVIEDDVLLPPNLANILPLLQQHLRTDEVILLYHTPADGCQLTTHDQAALADGHRLHYPLEPAHLWSTAAYMLRLPVARQLLKANYPVKYVCDWWGHLHAAHGFSSIRCVYPSLCQLRLDFPSDIRRGPQHRLAQRTLDLIYRYRIFPFSQILARKRRAMAAKKAARLTLVDTPSPLSAAPSQDR